MIPPVDGMLYGGPYQGTLIVAAQPQSGDKFTITVEGKTYQGEFPKAPILCAPFTGPEADEYHKSLPPIYELPTFHRDEIKPIKGVMHHVRQENDEYACSCGTRWDAAEGEDHP